MKWFAISGTWSIVVDTLNNKEHRVIKKNHTNSKVM